MKIYKCFVTGDEMLSDVYNITTVGCLYKVKGKYVSRSEKFDDSKIGANASAEEACEGTDDSSICGVDLVIDLRLQKTGFGTKKEFLGYFKDFIKKVEAYKKEKNPKEDLTPWRNEIQNTYKIIVADFDNYEFFTGESCNPDGTVAMLKWETPEEGASDVPYMYFFIDGLKEEKV